MNARFEFPTAVTIYNAIEIRDAMLAWASEQATQGTGYLQISARDVAEIDGSGLQLLASLSNMGQRWHLVDASTAFMQACRSMGFDHWLDLLDQQVAA